MTSTDLDTAVDRLARARARRHALAPLRHLITDADQDARAAAIAAADAGMTERAIAARLDVAQPTIHTWLDGRATTPVPGPSTATTAWALHHIATALASEVARLRADRLPGAPSSRHTSPADSAGRVHGAIVDAATLLGGIAAALDYDSAKQAA